MGRCGSPTARSRAAVGDSGPIRVRRLTGSREPISVGGRPCAMSNERVPDRGLPKPARRQARHSVHAVGSVLAMAALLAACGAGASPSPARTPGATPGPTATPEGSPPIDHPTGERDVILRFDEGGGFVPPSFLAVQVPYFTLYGDGTVIYRSATEPPLEQTEGDPLRFPPLRMAKMIDAQVQELLRAALVDGGLALARARYDNAMVADAPTATFTIRAGGLAKTVSVYALGMEAEPGLDSTIRRQMAAFAERLRTFDKEVATGRASDAGLYAPDRFRGTLFETGGRPVQNPRRWPWPAFGPDAFVEPPSGQFGLPSKVLSGLEAGLVGVDPIAGGASGIAVLGPDGRTAYELGLRPLLPDETR